MIEVAGGALTGVLIAVVVVIAQLRARRQPKVRLSPRPNVAPYDKWYGWPWCCRLKLNTRRGRVEYWLLSKRYRLAVRLLGPERAKPFDFIPF